MKERVILVAVILTFLLIGIVRAETPQINDIEISNVDTSNIFWMSNSQSKVTISFTCLNCDNATIEINDDFGPVYVDNDGDNYNYEYTIRKPGTHEVTIKGNSANESITESVTFIAKKLELNIISPTINFPIVSYKGQEFQSIKFEFNLVGDVTEKITGSNLAKVDFWISLISMEGEKIDIKGDSEIDYFYDTENENWILNPFISQTFPSGIYDITLHAIYNKYDPEHEIEITDSTADSMIIKHSLEAEILYPTTSEFLSLDGTKEISVKLRVSDKGNPVVFSRPDFTFYIGDEMIECLPIQDKNDKYIWNLKMVVPKKEAGPHDITVYVSYMGETTYPASLVEEKAIHFIIALKGRIMDASGTVRHIKMELENDDSSMYYLIENGNDGRYSANIIPGEYDMKIEFEGMNAEFMNVELTEENVEETSIADGPINYDVPKNIKTIDDGIDVVKIAVLEFDLPFDFAELTIPYSDAEIKNEENLEVYKCNNWNFGKSICSSEWEKIENVYVNTRGNIVMLNTTQPSAFVIGERKNLVIKLGSDLGYGDYSAGDQIEIKGQITDMEDEAIEGADVEIKIIGIEGLNDTTKSIISGNFKSDLTLPLEEGIFNISMRAKKYPYKDAIKYFTIETDVKKEISFINIPDGEKAYVGEPLNIKFSVLNSGQTDLTNIRLYVSGLATEWYQLLPVSINDLSPGDVKEVELKILVSKTYCEKQECKNYYPVTIQAKSDEVESEALMTITLRQEKETTAEEINETKDSETKNSPFSLEGLITGELATGESAESIAIYGGVIIIVVLVVLSIRKKYTMKIPNPMKTRTQGKDSNVLQFMKTGIKKKDPQSHPTSHFGGLLGQNRDKDKEQ